MMDAYGGPTQEATTSPLEAAQGLITYSLDAVERMTHRVHAIRTTLGMPPRGAIAEKAPESASSLLGRLSLLKERVGELDELLAQF